MRVPLSVAFIAFLLLSTGVEARPLPLPELDTPRPGTRVLVIAPHIDDEGLAAGGYVADALAAGAEVFVVYLTAGDHSRTALTLNRLTFFAAASLNQKGDRRWREGRAAARTFGLPEANLLLLGYPDRGLRRMMLRPDRAVRSVSTGKSTVPYADARSYGAPYRAESILADLLAIVEDVRPHVVIAPDEHDHHSDHRAAAAMVDSVLTEAGQSPERLGYMIHGRGVRAPRLRAGPGREPVVYLLTAETQRNKQRILSDYRSQRRSPYLRLVFARSRAPRELFVRYHG